MVDAGTLIYSVAKGLIWGVLIFAPILGGFWYMVVMRVRRVYHCNIWEMTSEGTYRLVDKDKVIEKRLKGKSVHTYKLKKRKYDVPPVEDEHIYIYKNKRCADYLRIRDDYYPLSRKNYQDKDGKWTLDLKPMDYDVTMQMINIDLQLEKMLEADKHWFERYQLLILLVTFGVFCLMALKMHYDFVIQAVEPVVSSNSAVVDAITGFVNG